MPRFTQPSFPLSRAGFVQPGEAYAEVDARVLAWVARIEAGWRAAWDASAGVAAGAGFALAPAGAGFVPAP
jgi:hypothetical protein